MKKKLSEYYEEAAHACGFKDWNILCAMISESDREHLKQAIKFARAVEQLKNLTETAKDGIERKEH